MRNLGWVGRESSDDRVPCTKTLGRSIARFGWYVSIRDFLLGRLTPSQTISVYQQPCHWGLGDFIKKAPLIYGLRIKLYYRPCGRSGEDLPGDMQLTKLTWPGLQPRPFEVVWRQTSNGPVSQNLFCLTFLSLSRGDSSFKHAPGFQILFLKLSS